MIRIQKDYKKIPEKLKSKACFKQIEAVLKEKESHKFASYHYRDGCLADLQKLYHQKCAYCETDPSTGSSLQVEHFRGKDKNSRNSKDSEDRHAYYWLAYEWSNLLLGCAKCNSYKSDHFPIAEDGIRVYEPVKNAAGQLISEHQLLIAPHFLDEKPLLLNPEVDDVEDHFVINSKGEWIVRTEKAHKTAAICQLNRDDLLYAHKECIEKFVRKIERHLDYFLNEGLQQVHFQKYMNDEFKLLETKIANHVPYSRTYWFMFNDFEDVILPHISDDGKAIVFNAFKKFLDPNEVW
jgi:uncharacterized protein (TIGR02646 family)